MTDKTLHRKRSDNQKCVPQNVIAQAHIYSTGRNLLLEWWFFSTTVKSLPHGKSFFNYITLKLYFYTVKRLNDIITSFMQKQPKDIATNIFFKTHLPQQCHKTRWRHHADLSSQSLCNSSSPLLFATSIWVCLEKSYFLLGHCSK